MESEPVRVLCVAANDCAGNTVAFDSLALLTWRMKPQGAVTAWKACGRQLNRIHWKMRRRRGNGP
jgi:hypothetical protein